MTEGPATPKELRDLIASALYSTSANHLPAVCTEFGLSPGSREEAFRSKLQYVRGRLMGKSVEELLKVARRVLSAHPDHALQEAVNRSDDMKSRAVTSLTRRQLFKALNGVNLSGDDDLLEFLRRFWPIDTLAWTYSDNSDSHPFVEYVVQHVIANDDVTNEKLLEQLGARTCSQSLLFRFLEAVVHPEIRQADEQSKLVEELNTALHRDGFALMPTRPISGYPTFSIRELAAGTPADAAISEVLSAFDEDGVHAAWRKALNRRSADPEGAITAARTLLETVCKHIVEASTGTLDDNDDLPTLYRKAAEVLNLAPDQHTERTFKAILGSCQNVVNSLATLRNRLSDAHGRGRKPVRPSARHAELAVNLAGTMATFLVSTWNAKSKAGA